MAAEELLYSRNSCAQASVIPQWEWCLRTDGNLDDLPNSAWGIYDNVMNERIEQGWRLQQAKVDVEVGIRNFEIIFDGRKIWRRGGSVQYDAANQKLRQVRRRLVSTEERAAALREAIERNYDRRISETMCAICVQTFDANPLIQTIDLQCGHVFHSACAQGLADRAQPCPLCRRQVVWADAGLTPSRRSCGMWTGTSRSSAGDPGINGRQPVHLASRVSWAVPPDAGASQGPPGNAVGVHPGNDQGLWMLLRAQQGNLDEVRTFITDGVNIDQRSPGGATALISAAGHGHVDVVRFLLDAGADTRIQTNRGSSAYHVAIARGHRHIAQMLAQHDGA